MAGISIFRRCSERENKLKRIFFCWFWFLVKTDGVGGGSSIYKKRNTGPPNADSDISATSIPTWNHLS